MQEELDSAPKILTFCVVCMYIYVALHCFNSTCTQVFCFVFTSYPYPVPIFPGLVRKFFPGALYLFLGRFAALNAETGPENVP